MDDYSIVLDTFKMIYLEVRDYRIRGAVRPKYHQPMHFCMGLSGNLSLEQGGIFFMAKRILLQAKNIKVSFGEQDVLDFEEFTVAEGERVGLVGMNGAGKTTLLKVLAGELEPQRGSVALFCEPFFFQQFSKRGYGWETCTTQQDISGKMGKMLAVKDKIWQEQVSGGEDTRIRLAEMFSSEKLLVFLDEPTTNLDRKGISLLKEMLEQVSSMVLVSHDRALLNALCNRIVEVADGKLKSFPGNYDVYQKLKRAEVDRQWQEYENYTREKKRLERIYFAKKEKARSIERRPKNMSDSDSKDVNFGGNRKIEDKARGMERAASNVQKRMEHMEVKEKPRDLARIRPDFRLTNPPQNRIVISGEHISFSYEAGRAVFTDASFQIRNGARIAIVGDNGAGKTTLLHLIAQAARGEKNGISVVPGASIGFFEQNLGDLDPEKTVLENVMEVSVQKEEVARMILARLLLSERDMKKKVGVLSGGERIKLAFAKLFVGKINMLILDEPTNYLDIPSVEALEEMFREYEGTLVFVSHDEAFIRAVATDVVEVRQGEVISFYGTPEEFFDKNP